MAGKKPPEAVHAFIEPLQRALDCVTDVVLNHFGGYMPRDTPHHLVLGNGTPVPLKGPHKLSFSLSMRYRIVKASGERGPWKVSVTTYLYILHRDVDHGQHELLGYHWHPDVEGETKAPHLHIEAGADAHWPPLAKAHLPTERVALEDVLRLAVRDFSVEPRRDDWSAILSATQQKYEAWRTWPRPQNPVETT